VALPGTTVIGLPAAKAKTFCTVTSSMQRTASTLLNAMCGVLLVSDVYRRDLLGEGAPAKAPNKSTALRQE
jgi:hypothetical protein